MYVDSVIAGRHWPARFTGRSPAREGQSPWSTVPFSAWEGDDCGCMRMPLRFFDITVVAVKTNKAFIPSGSLKRAGVPRFDAFSHRPPEDRLAGGPPENRLPVKIGKIR